MYIFRKTTATTATTATQLMGIYKCIHVLLSRLYKRTYNINFICNFEEFLHFFIFKFYHFKFIS